MLFIIYKLSFKESSDKRKLMTFTLQWNTILALQHTDSVQHNGAS